MSSGYVKYAVSIRKQELENDNGGQKRKSSQTKESAQVVRVQLEDQARKVTAEVVGGVSGTLEIPQVKQWWPLGMVPEDQTAHLYNLKVCLLYLLPLS